MSKRKYAIIRAAFETFSLLKIPGIIRRFSECRGVIFTLHRVLPEPPAEFAPNAILQITPEFLESVIVTARKRGFDIVTMDEALMRIKADKPAKPFVVLTFDDAYRDNIEHALPVLEAHEAPFLLYVPTAFVEGRGEIWWQALEDIVRDNEILLVEDDEIGCEMAISELAEKQKAYDKLYWHMRRIPEAKRVDLIRKLARKHGYDLTAQCHRLIMDWDELYRLSANPLCSVGAHTIHHYELAKLPKEQARREIKDSAETLRDRLGILPRHFSYPIGAPSSAGQREFDLAKELGFASAVTTRPGGLYAEHAKTLTALPRISLNGLYQGPRYADVYLTGEIFTRFGARAKSL